MKRYRYYVVTFVISSAAFKVEYTTTVWERSRELAVFHAGSRLKGNNAYPGHPVEDIRVEVA